MDYVELDYAGGDTSHCPIFALSNISYCESKKCITFLMFLTNAILNSAFHLRKFPEPNFLSCIWNILLISSIMRNREMKNFLYGGDCLFSRPRRRDYLQEWMSWILLWMNVQQLLRRHKRR